MMVLSLVWINVVACSGVNASTTCCLAVRYLLYSASSKLEIPVPIVVSMTPPVVIHELVRLDGSCTTKN